MYINDNQRIDLFSILTVKIGSNQINKIVKVFRLLSWLFLHCIFIALSNFVKYILNSPSPPYLCTWDGNHTQVLQNPLYPFLLTISENWLFHDFMQGSFHFFINFSHPQLNRTFLRFDKLLQREFFTLIRLHALDLLTFWHNQLFTVVKQF